MSYLLSIAALPIGMVNFSEAQISLLDFILRGVLVNLKVSVVLFSVDIASWST